MPNQRRMPPPPPPRRGFAPAFGRRSQGRDSSGTNSPGSQRAFAPAFARKTTPAFEEDEFNSSGAVPFEYLAAPSFEDTKSTWTIFDPSTGETNWKQEAPKQGEVGSEGFGIWNNFGHGNAHNATALAKDASSLFVPVSNILDASTGPRTEFEKRNASVLAIGRGTSKIVNMIGDQEISTVEQKIDTRLRYLGEDGKYVDGVDRGQVKKRYLEEHQIRVEKRREEISKYSKLMTEWNALSKEEQDARIQKAKINNEIMQARLGIEETDEERDPERCNFDDFTAYVPDVEDSDEEPLFVRSDESDTDAEEGTVRAKIVASRKRKASPDVSFEGSRTVAKKVSYSIQKEQTTPRSWSKHSHSPYTSPQSRRPGVESKQKTIDRAPIGPRAWREKLAVRNFPMKYTPKIFDVPSAASVNTFKVTSWPELVPLQDLDNEKQLPKGKPLPSNACHKVYNWSKTNGRVVILSLHPSVEFSGEAVSKRIFGGLIQEFQYFPDDRQAAVFFVHPWAAAAFIRHVDNARQESAHEYQRLQIACDWYKSDEVESVYVQQEQTLVHALVHGGTRVLMVKNVHRGIKLSDLAAAFRVTFKEQLLIKVKLVTPKKRYERADVNSNSAVLEFASIKAAYEAKTTFDNHQVREFEHCTTTYLPDPVQEPPVAQQYCDCLHCRNGEGSGNSLFFATETTAQLDEEEDSSDAKATNSASRSRGDNAELLRSVWQARRENLSYDCKEDSRKPWEFDDRRYREKVVGVGEEENEEEAEDGDDKDDEKVEEGEVEEKDEDDDDDDDDDDDEQPP